MQCDPWLSLPGRTVGCFPPLEACVAPSGMKAGPREEISGQFHLRTLWVKYVVSSTIGTNLWGTIQDSNNRLVFEESFRQPLTIIQKKASLYPLTSVGTRHTFDVKTLIHIKH